MIPIFRLFFDTSRFSFLHDVFPMREYFLKYISFPIPNRRPAGRPPITHGWTLPLPPIRLDYILKIGWPIVVGRVEERSIWLTRLTALIMGPPKPNDGNWWAPSVPSYCVFGRCSGAHRGRQCCRGPYPSPFGRVSLDSILLLL